ncbi:MAG: 16S rRNA (cytidine(1402)-2'-O)-methyltransferase [Patescibacteria group bacterium]
MGILYIVSTPIGNLQDISFRAAGVLQKVSMIACEDTRRTGLLLQFINEKFPNSKASVRPNLVSYFEQNEAGRTPQILTALRNDIDVALVSDAGTPTVSDPGFKLVRTCIEEGVRVVAVPGASSVLAGLVSSGLPTDKFLFLGYLPHKQGHRIKMLQNIKGLTEIMKMTVIVFEAPHKMKKFLAQVLQELGDIDLVVCRELTKIHEEVIHAHVSDLIARYMKQEPRGEFVILFHHGDNKKGL